MYFVIFPGRDNKYYWRLVDGADIIAIGGEGHPTRDACETEIRRVQMCGTAPIRHSY